MFTACPTVKKHRKRTPSNAGACSKKGPANENWRGLFYQARSILYVDGINQLAVQPIVLVNLMHLHRLAIIGNLSHQIGLIGRPATEIDRNIAEVLISGIEEPPDACASARRIRRSLRISL